MKVTVLALFITCCFCLSGCTSFKYDYEFGPGFVEKERPTFALLPIPHPEFDKLAHQVLGSGDLSLEVVRGELERCGLTFHDSEAVDYLVGLRVELLSRDEGEILASVERPDALFFGHGTLNWVNDGAPRIPGLASTSHVRFPADAGLKKAQSVKLSVTVFDVKTREVVWSGWAVGAGFGSFG